MVTSLDLFVQLKINNFLFKPCNSLYLIEVLNSCAAESERGGSMIQSNSLQQPPVYKDHLSIKTTFLDSLGGHSHVNEPVNKDHMLL